MVRLSVGLILLVVFTGRAQSYQPVDAGSTVGFKIRNFGTTVEGSFTGLAGSIAFDPEHPEKAKISVTVNAASINTGIGLRDKHLKKEDYLAAATHPTLSFSSSRITFQKPGEGRAEGTLTIKKTSRQVTIPFTYTILENTLNLKGELTINRRDFDVGGNSLTMADDVRIVLDVQAMRIAESDR